MSVETALVARVTTDPAVTAVLGTRFHALVIPQDGPLPAARYARVGTTRSPNMGRDADVETVEIQIDVFAPDFDTARDGVEAIKARLDRWRDGAERVQDTLIRNEFDDFESDRDLYRATLLLTVFAERT